MGKINEFMNKAFPKFKETLEGGITDLFFLYVQSDRELMKVYLDTVSEVGDLRVVNSQIAQQLAQLLSLKNTGEEISVPHSHLIQSCSILKKED